VLFDVTSMKDYGQLSNRKMEDQKAGARVAVEAHKKNPGDFVLWKLSSAEEPGWESPWGRGRPGWHIECSAMSKQYLGEVFDIHGGGLDLIFPHHENEIAQSRCAHDTKVMANVWMHNGFLQVEGQKMSKSDGNFYTIADLLETDKFHRVWKGKELRLAMLMTNYRQPIDWTKDRLIEASTKLGVFKNSVRGAIPEKGVLIPSVVGALNDDLNTHEALLKLEKSTKSSKNDLAHTLVFLGLMDFEDQHFVLGRRNVECISESVKKAFELADQKAGLEVLGITEDEVHDFIISRDTARAAKDWKESDRIRDELAAMGVTIKDNKDGTTSWEVKR
jgi:cysteinyl-tRNA synthetase